MKEKKTISKEERKKIEAERAEYIGNITDNMLKAIENVFEKTEPKPTGIAMIDSIALSSVLFFARQIHLSCNSKATMKSVMKSTIWALTSQINALADPLIKIEEEWSKLLEGEEEEGGDNEQG